MRRAAAVVAAGALVFLAGCSGDDDGGGGSSERTPGAAPAEVVLTPADGAQDVSPITPLEISVTGGELADVTVVDAQGSPVEGETAAAPGDPATEVWTAATPLAYGTTYTLTATATDGADEETEASATFTTVTPATLSTPSIGPLDGTTVGVGMPIRVYFDDPVADKAAAESHLRVTTSTPTDGAWNWLTDSEVHFRPSQYWPAGIEVTLDAELYGVDLGEGVWGEKDRTVSFSVGDRHVSVVDAATHVMDVYDGDRLVQSFPMSAGSAENPTRNGPHVVTESHRDITMDSSTFGLAVDAPGGYRTDVEYAVRISNNGEFVHAAPWSESSQGIENVSHGCINLSTDRAGWFFGFAQPGDVVEVKNSIGPQLSAADGDIYDWAIPWEEWKAGSALK
ncbi:L,D-transpeptidase family protein [Blastococcus sp. TML/M2B]|uniref:L,D-transpeptidase n=1 Tax=Blastococcus sp. TML/M2B TaxID=2798727 RepID=UPI00190DB503|nr:Ig-like domain-containing protein [Blastococcus sp. TML/M2B]MBN1091973.1 L,D-transpeptidase family protein [Blastococcus sp. TML/M2B]